MTRRVWTRGLLLTALLLRPAAASAQQSPPLVKYGKWGALAAAIAMGIQSASAHSDAERAYDRLRGYCFGDFSRCALGPGGHYLDPVSEGYYQTAVGHDRTARRWLFGGEAAFAGAVALFVWEFTRPKEPPGNIPFEPEIRVLPRQTEFGLKVPF